MGLYPARLFKPEVEGVRPKSNPCIGDVDGAAAREKVGVDPFAGRPKVDLPVLVIGAGVGLGESRENREDVGGPEMLDGPA